jgi:16S rRNA pseudouridine516 synthase
VPSSSSCTTEGLVGARPLRLAQILYSQGFGTRRECAALAHGGSVVVGGRIVDDPDTEVEISDGLTFDVNGQSWPYHEKALLLMHKPAGTECSQRPRHHPSVLSLLPPPLRRRGVQPVGRLDEDTTGVLLLTDDGALLHRLTSPKHHVRKVYDVRTRHEVTPAQIAQLRDGVQLADDPRPVRAASADADGAKSLRLVLTEGRYHQVKRMVAAAGNRVESLHRSAFGPVVLPPGLGPGQWCWLAPAALGPLAGAVHAPGTPS